MNVLRRIRTRTAAFFVKEGVVALGQRRLLVSVILGPFLLLFLFGAGFSGTRPPIDVVLVVPDRANVPVEVEAYRGFFLWSLELKDVTTNLSRALERLAGRDVDLVVVAPDDPLNDLANDEAATFIVYYNELDPVERGRINGLAFGHTRELNALLVAAVLQGVLEATGVRESEESAIDQLATTILAGDADGSIAVIDRLLAAVAILRLSGEGIYGAASSGGSDPPTESLDRFELLLRALRAEASDEPGITPDQRQQLDELRGTADALPAALQVAANISTGRLAAPADYALVSTAPSDISYVRFYSPVVVALLLQHVGITLVSLSVIRERTRGTVELFAVAPIRLSEILAGKALSFGLMLAVIGATLVGLLVFILDVPFLGSALLAALVLGLLISVSIAIGFVIAAMSTTESQTVQLAMLVLLFAIFFGGLFVPVYSLDLPIRYIAFGVPVTHAGTALRDLMLRGELLDGRELVALLLMNAILVPLAYLVMRRTFRGT